MRGILIDLSGTIHIEDSAIPGAVEAINSLLARKDLKVRFISNTTKQSTKSLVELLHKIGFTSMDKSIVFTSLNVTLKYVSENFENPLIFLEEEAMSEYAAKAESSIGGHDAVVIGLAPSKFDYDHLNTAFRALHSTKSAQLLAFHKGRYFERKDGLSLGPGAFVAGLEYATGKEAMIMGKPSKIFFQLVLDDMGLLPEECVMIGDDVKDDIGGALGMGMKGFLVQTGKYRHGDELKYGDIIPTGVFKDISEALKSI